MPSEDDLRQRLSEADVAEKALRAEECRLRLEATIAEASRDAARQREQRAKEAAEDARRRVGRGQEFLRGELAELMQQVASLERREAENGHHEAAWREELNALVLQQAEHMVQRDNLAEQSKVLEAQARQDGARAAAAEAKVAKTEEKRKKERACMKVIQEEQEVHREEAGQVLAEQRRLAAALERLAAGASRRLLRWRLLALASAALAGLAAAARAAAQGPPLR